MERLPLSLPLLLSLFLLPTGQPQRDCYIMDDRGHYHVQLSPTLCTVPLTSDASPVEIHLAVDQNSSSCNWIWSADGSSFAQLWFGDSSEHSWTGNTSIVFSHAQRKLIISCWNPVENKVSLSCQTVRSSLDVGSAHESPTQEPTECFNCFQPRLVVFSSVYTTCRLLHVYLAPVFHCLYVSPTGVWESTSTLPNLTNSSGSTIGRIYTRVVK